MDTYIQYVNQEAKKLGKIFIVDSGEGRAYRDEKTGWLIEDLSGWLIDVGLIDKFNQIKEQQKEYDTFGDEYIFAIWKKDEKGNVSIDFKKFDLIRDKLVVSPIYAFYSNS